MSKKTVAEKLLIKPDATVWLSHPDRLELVEPLPAGSRAADAPDGADVAVFFAEGEAPLRELLQEHQGWLGQAKTLWVAYPKGNRIDLNRDTLWPILGEYGLRPIGQVSVDDIWSALRFRPLRPGEAQFSGGK